MHPKPFLLSCFYIFISMSFIGSVFGQEKYYGGDNGKKMDWVLYYLNEYYVDSTDTDYLTDVAIRSIVEQLDPYSNYQTAEDIERQRNADEGYSDEGYGFYFSNVGKEVMVTHIFKEGPAAIAGLKNLDKILSVNGKSTIGKFQHHLPAEIEDEAVRELVLEISVPPSSSKTLKISKDRVPLISLESAMMVSQDIAYFKFQRFTAKTIEEFTSQVSKLNANSFKNIIIDLRGNPGGVITAATGMADQFLEKNKIVTYSQGFNLERKEYVTESKNKFPNKRLIILIDDKSISASELFASSLQDWDRALIIGKPSFGKGLIQQSYQLDDGSALRLTIGKYFTPTGRNLQKDHLNEEACLASFFKNINYTVYSTEMGVSNDMIYQTKGNRRIVACQGGIIPDVFVPSANVVDASYDALNKEGFLFSFTCDYTNRNAKELRAQYPNYKDFADDQSIDPVLRQAFQSFVETKILALGLPVELFPQTVSNKILRQIKSWIAGQLWDTNAYYYTFQKDDALLKTAIDAFTNGSFEKLGVE